MFVAPYCLIIIQYSCSNIRIIKIGSLSRWVDNIKMDLLEIGWGRCGLDWSSSG
jgi:hypothetical protein